MLKWRLVSFPLLLGLLAFIFLAPEKYGYPVFALAATLVIPLAVFECARMLDRAGIGTMPVVSGIFSLAMVGSCMYGRYSNILITALCAALITLPWLLILVYREFAVERVFNTAGVILLVMTPFLLLAMTGFDRLLFIMLATKAMDTGGYIFGMLSGRFLPGGNHKLCPKVSPKKSWEGAAGGMALSLLVGWGFFAWKGDMPLVRYLAFAALLAVASVLGDLTESALKRRCGVKDSGNWIPGMGGALDVLDSFIYTALVCGVFTYFSGRI